MYETSNDFNELFFDTTVNAPLVDLIYVGISKYCGIDLDARFLKKNIQVYATRAVWENYIEFKDEDDQLDWLETGNSIAHLVIKLEQVTENAKDKVIFFEHYEAPRNDFFIKYQQITLKAMMGVGDNGKTTITAMLPNEDC